MINQISATSPPTKNPTNNPTTATPTADPTKNPTSTPTLPPTVHPCNDGTHKCWRADDGTNNHAKCTVTGDTYDCHCLATYSTLSTFPHVCAFTDSPTPSPTKSPQVATPSPTPVPTSAPTPNCPVTCDLKHPKRGPAHNHVISNHNMILIETSDTYLEHRCFRVGKKCVCKCRQEGGGSRPRPGEAGGTHYQDSIYTRQMWMTGDETANPNAKRWTESKGISFERTPEFTTQHFRDMGYNVGKGDYPNNRRL